ncbi:hypothetical protein [Roseateles oligotrophus]|uniref:Uncharacterized protein n=1 Tax=Roseateles oligotrophus TaxID=1769250 RepID=A0ABT2YDA1_9BURK|nr:hypothetical protein [Roseateles oligotrophus]MCV2368004.1 hypothetical protein [Roseateles oligotrophus]
MVVHVGESCETHLLPVPFEPLLKAPFKVVAVDEPGRIELTPDGAEVNAGLILVSRNFIEELIQLKVLESIS